MNYRLNQYSFIFLLLLIIARPISAQEKIDVSFESLGDDIHIYYTLNAEPEDEYEISVVLKRTSVPDFEYIPSDISGDVGKGKYAGDKKTIIWKVSSEEMKMFDGDDFYFKVNAQKIEETGGLPWYAYVGGAVVGGVVAAVVFLTGGDDNTETPPVSGFAQPPGRP